MKTQQAAKLYSTKLECQLAFSAGVEFAQRWISIDDKLPEEQGYYLVKVEQSYPKNINILVTEFYTDNKTFYCEYSDSPINDVTHWRLIELK
jgi:hypothetical protein